jgi:uncharacterized membrane protein YGL010W
MKNLTDHLTTYAAYHRDRRNIATHFVGIPMITVAVATLLARPAFAVVAGLPLSPAVLVTAGAILFYLALDLRFGLTMGALLAASLWAATSLAAQSTTTWLAAGLGLFVVGWIIQFIGHAFEGKKPAFVDDLFGLLIGPLFVVVEAGFALGARDQLRRTIEERVGPTLIRSRHESAALPLER